MRKDYPIKPIPFTRVRLDDTFWRPRLEVNRDITITYDFKKCEETGRIDNFSKAAGWMPGPFIGIRFNDSDVYKIIEGASYSLSLRPDPELNSYLDEIITRIAAAQEDDGYLFTTRTIDPHNLAPDSGDTRWSFLRSSHEFYNVGHLYEAAAAHYLATGKRSLLDIALKNADLIDKVFGAGKIQSVPGHEEIEIGLVKLSLVTGEQRYLDLAKFFVEERGQAHGRELYGDYAQDHLPIREQNYAVGHAVRAGYFYAGVADVAALTGDASLIEAIDRIWEDVVSHKLYITGGIGARHQGEAFGEAYELPNATAYNETCAAIANIMWNHRLFLLHGDAGYVDILERTLYNGFLAGVGFSGTEFFYPNPLSADGLYAFNQGSMTRQPWFHCSCCPSNVVRLLPSLPGYIYAQREETVFVNLFISGSASFVVQDVAVALKQDTLLPWGGAVALTLTPEKPAVFTLKVRIPGWVRGQPVPSDLYRYQNPEESRVHWFVNGEEVEPEIDGGYASLSRRWHPGDQITFEFPMP
ncbi:MAG: glycoside hydrolase family 127 protein, partial [Anaerolineales bacterium]